MNDKNLTRILKSLDKKAPAAGFEERVINKIVSGAYSFEAVGIFFKTAKTSLIAAAFFVFAAAALNFMQTARFAKTAAIEDVNIYVLSGSFADGNINKYVLG
jgi:hypothetical protein